jgi:TldD protein
MFDRLKEMLARVDADHGDVRYELMHETKVGFSGRELTSLSSSSTDGYVLSALKAGGLASIAFTKPDDAPRAAATAVENALLMARHAKEPVTLAKADVVKDKFTPVLGEDPRRLSIDEKLALTRHYNDIPLAHKQIASTQTVYNEVVREKWFVNSEGTEVHEELVTVRLMAAITSQDGSLTQRVVIGFGGSDGLQRLRGREPEMEARTGVAVDLLKTQPVTAGTYRVVLDPWLAGVFTHEAFGHFSEADLIQDSPTMREKMKLGTKLGSDIVNITDDPTQPHQLGFYKYDDEGVPARPVQLMKNGVLTGRLHSRRTAAALGEPLSGHCVAEDYRYPPIVRMGNIFMEPGTAGLEELLGQLGDGLLLVDSKGGQTSGENFTFGAQYGFIVKAGRPVQMVRDVNIGGNLYSTLQNIVGVGNKVVLGEIGGCGKGQTNIRSSYGAPHILVEGVVVGGR